MFARLMGWLRSLFGGSKREGKGNMSAAKKNEFKARLESFERQRDLQQTELSKLDRDLDALDQNERAATAEFNATAPDSRERKKVLEKIADIRKRIGVLKPSRAVLVNNIAALDKMIAELRKTVLGDIGVTAEEIDSLQLQMKEMVTMQQAVADAVKNGDYVVVEDTTDQELKDLERELTKAPSRSDSPMSSARTAETRTETI